MNMNMQVVAFREHAASIDFFQILRNETHDRFSLSKIKSSISRKYDGQHQVKFLLETVIA